MVTCALLEIRCGFCHRFIMDTSVSDERLDVLRSIPFSHACPRCSRRQPVEFAVK